MNKHNIIPWTIFTCLLTHRKYAIQHVWYSDLKIYSFSADFSFFYCSNLRTFFYFSPIWAILLWFQAVFSFFEHFQCFWQKVIFRCGYCSWQWRNHGGRQSASLVDKIGLKNWERKGKIKRKTTIRKVLAYADTYRASYVPEDPAL